MSERVTITIDGRQVAADPVRPLIHACHEHGFEVPHYCYHPGLTPVGSCRICQVEVRQGDLPARVMVACRTPVAAGMVVDTESPEAHATRRECLEFLLKNHPLDCPICDKAGECTLQDYAFDEGQGEGRTVEPRRKLEKRKDLGEVILLDQERCILCSRCVRFMEEVPKSPQLCISMRGADSVVETFADRPLSGNYLGNLADICPVGALTLKPFRFQARVWNLVKTASTCAECSRGCAITVEVLRKGEVKRFRPLHDEAVNGYWMCDHGRFAFEHANAPGRLRGALQRGYSGFEPVAVEEALENAAAMFAVHPAPLVVASPFLTQEEGRALADLARELGGRALCVVPPASDLADELLHTGEPCPNRRGLVDLGFEPAPASDVLAGLREARSALLVGERVVELVGAEALGELPAALRLVVLDCHACELSAVDVCVGIPCHVERAGTWINAGGLERRVSSARPVPPGVWLTTRVLAELGRASSVASGEGARA